MNKITEYLDKASAAYYAGTPILSDEVFDRLAESSYYNKVGAKQHDHLKKHYRQMFSLQKYYEDEGVKPLQGIKGITTTPKLDGAAISILYVEGTLVRVLTRGDGTEGTDVTDKFLTANIIPLSIPDEGVLQVTGEIVAPKNIPNARNYAAGSLNLKDISEFKTRAIHFYAYGVYPYLRTTFSKDMQALKTLGFNTVYDEGIMDVYPCDGLVFRVDNNEDFTKLGYTAQFPKGSYALKERQEAVETQILSVEWQVGRTGKVTPVAILKPVMIGDALISRATLNNQAFIEALDIQIGDTVAVRRAGMIIPEICYKVEA